MFEGFGWSDWLYSLLNFGQKRSQQISEDYFDEEMLSDDEGDEIYLEITRVPVPIPQPPPQIARPALQPLSPNKPINLDPPRSKPETPKKVDKNGFSSNFNKLCPKAQEEKDQPNKSMTDLITFRKQLSQGKSGETKKKRELKTVTKADEEVTSNLKVIETITEKEADTESTIR